MWMAQVVVMWAVKKGCPRTRNRGRIRIGSSGDGDNALPKIFFCIFISYCP